MHPNDIDYIRTIPGYETLISKEISRPVPSQNQNHTFSKVDPEIIARAAAIEISEPSASGFTYNGFNWKQWFIQAGVAPGDAISYGQKFAQEKMDGSSLPSLDRVLLRHLDVSEGDIIRIKRSIVDNISVENSASIERENEAQARNLEKIRKVILKNNVQVSNSHRPSEGTDVNKLRQEQIQKDEVFARKLQLEEVQPQKNKLNGNS